MPAQASPHTPTPDVLDSLIEDHRKILQLFDEFQSIKNHADDETKQTLVDVVCTELVIHAQIEDEYLYPALRDTFDDLSLVDEAVVEHTMARQLISELESMHPDDALYDAKFTVLGQYVRHHIDEEQNRIFPKIRQSGMDLKTLGEEILQLRQELRSEFGVPEDGYDEDSDDSGFHQHRKWRYPHHH